MDLRFCLAVLPVEYVLFNSDLTLITSFHVQPKLRLILAMATIVMALSQILTRSLLFGLRTGMDGMSLTI